MSCTLFSNFRGDPWQWPVKSFTQTCRHARIGHYNICMTKKDGSKHEWSKKHLGCHTLMWYPYPHFFWFLIADMSWHINFHSILYLTSLFPKYTHGPIPQKTRQVPLDPEPPKKIIKFTPPLWKQRRSVSVSSGLTSWDWIHQRTAKVDPNWKSTLEMGPRGTKMGDFMMVCFQNWHRIIGNPQQIPEFWKIIVCFFGGDDPRNLDQHPGPMWFCWGGGRALTS